MVGSGSAQQGRFRPLQRDDFVRRLKLQRRRNLSDQMWSTLVQNDHFTNCVSFCIQLLGWCALPFSLRHLYCRVRSTWPSAENDCISMPIKNCASFCKRNCEFLLFDMSSFYNHFVSQPVVHGCHHWHHLPCCLNGICQGQQCDQHLCSSSTERVLNVDNNSFQGHHL